LVLLVGAVAADSRCNKTEARIDCTNNQFRFDRCSAAALQQRLVYWETPLGIPPPQGWPAVLMFQGSFFNAGLCWGGVAGAPFGMYYQADVVKELLDANFTVITPNAHLEGFTFWDTNVPYCRSAWKTCPDSCFMRQISDAMKSDLFGPVDMDNLFATGISSGGYMTSRMAEAYHSDRDPDYPFQFKALAVASGSWCDCIGPICTVPGPVALPQFHPPTLFLHGEKDGLVPLRTAVTYYENLLIAGHNSSLVLDENAGHEWIPAAPKAVLEYFQTFQT